MRINYFDLKDTETGLGEDLRVKATQHNEHQIEFEIVREDKIIAILATFALDYFDGKLQLVIDRNIDQDNNEPVRVPLNTE